MVEDDEEEDKGAQERPTGKHRSPTRDMPPEVLGATRKDLDSGFSKQKATPTASVIPKTPQECVLQAQTYLMDMNPAADDPRHEFHQGILQGLSLAREELSQKENPRVTAAKTARQRESTGRDAEAAPVNPPRKSRYEEYKREEVDKSAARGTRRSNYEDDPKDMHSKLAQGRVDRRRQEAERQGYAESEEEEEVGLPCFASRIRLARKPKRFKLTAETPKYDGTEEPEAWLDDYLDRKSVV